MRKIVSHRLLSKERRKPEFNKKNWESFIKKQNESKRWLIRFKRQCLFDRNKSTKRVIV